MNKNKIRLFVGDRAISKIRIFEWAKQIEAKVHQSTIDDVEDLANPFNSVKTLQVFSNPSKEEMEILVSVLDYIQPNKYVAIVFESIDNRLSVFKLFSDCIIDNGFFVYAKKTECLKLIANMTKLEQLDCETIYSLIGSKEMMVANRNGNKVSTQVLNTDKLFNEIEKIDLLSGYDNLRIDKIVAKHSGASSWDVVESLFNKDFNDAISGIHTLVSDMATFLMFLGLVGAEAKLGLMLAMSKIRSIDGFLAQIKNNRLKDYCLDDLNSDDRKSKLDAHPYRLMKISGRKLSAEFYIHILATCQKFNLECRNDIPIEFLVDHFVLEIINC